MKMRSPLIITLVSTIITAINPAVFAQQQQQKDEIYIDRNCHRNQELSEFVRFTVFNQNEFTANGQKYFFYVARYQDGGVILCTSKPNFNQPKLLNEQKIQANFIEKIVPEPNNKTVFIITVREGNGFETPVTNYGLDLSNVDRPKLTSLSLLQRRETLKAGESREHTFQGRAGQSVTIWLKSRSLDHSLILSDPSGKKIAEKKGNSQNSRESELTIKLPSNGTYKLVVNGGDRTSKGTYTLSVNSDRL